jgi:putative resolvase
MAVSSHDRRGDLDRQVARLTEWATRRGLSVDEVVTEVGSAMNAKRRKLARVLLTRRRSPSWSSTATVSPASG